MKSIILAVLFVLFVPSLALASPICPDAQDKFEMEECIADLNAEARSSMSEYLSAAIERYSDDDQIVLDIKSAQVAWEAYQSAHCGSVFTKWGGGSIRFGMAQICAIYTTRMRTHDIWREFLTYMDSTPPILPEPEVR